MTYLELDALELPAQRLANKEIPEKLFIRHYNTWSSERVEDPAMGESALIGYAEINPRENPGVRIQNEGFAFGSIKIYSFAGATRSGSDTQVLLTPDFWLLNSPIHLLLRA